ncbi:MAG: GNAT family N-acetyltransferase [Candidatus Omnitrophota bacterium]
MKVRVFKKEDSDAVKDLILDILTKEYPFDKSAYSDSDLFNLSATYGGPREGFFVLEEDGKIIGTVGIKEDSKDVALLRRLFVESKYRGKGYGGLLMADAIKFCKEKSYGSLAFRTTNRMQQAIELCKKNGFRKEEELDLQGFQIYKFVLQLA